MESNGRPANTVDEIARALVRPIVTVLFSGGFVGFTWMGLISGDVFAGAALMVISFWFASRNQDRQDAKVVEVAEAIQKAAGPDRTPPPRMP
jgi:hypothetical protein